MDACSSLLPLSACVQGLLALVGQRRESKTRANTTWNWLSLLRRRQVRLFTRRGAQARSQSSSAPGACREWMRVGVCATELDFRRRPSTQRRLQEAEGLHQESWSFATRESNYPGLSGVGVQATHPDNGYNQVESCPAASTLRSHYQCRAEARPHHHLSSVHYQTSGIMANCMFVLLLLVTFLLHRCTGVIVHGNYECRSIKVPDSAAQSDASLGTGTAPDSRRATRIPVSGDQAAASAAPVIYSKGEFTNARYNTFQSPRATAWPNHYFPDMECWYNFTAPHGQHVYVEFPLVRIEGDSRMCHWDRDLLTIPTQHMGDRLICGSPTDYGATVTGLQTVNIHFKTNHAIEAAGFSGYFFAYPAQSAPTGRRRRKRETTNQLMQRLRRWISNPYVREMLRQELLKSSEDDTNAEDIISNDQQEVIARLRSISLNGRESVRQHGCHDCRIAHLFEPCECAGIQCAEHADEAKK